MGIVIKMAAFLVNALPITYAEHKVTVGRLICQFCSALLNQFRESRHKIPNKSLCIQSPLSLYRIRGFLLIPILLRSYPWKGPDAW